MRELFVYYRVATADASRCESIVRAFQARLTGDVRGLRARLLVRADAPDGEQTWMETYALDTGDVDAALQQRIEGDAAATRPLCRGTRHVEVFIAP